MLVINDPLLVPPTSWVYTEPATNATIRGDTLNRLIGLVSSHRIGNKLPPGDTAADVHAQLCSKLPEGWCIDGTLTSNYEPVSSGHRTQSKPRYSWGAAKWRELHTFAKHLTDLNEIPKFLSAFGKSIPCGECRGHWGEILRRHGPDQSSPQAFFAWTVMVHNLVNATLGYTEMSVDEAFLLY